MERGGGKKKNLNRACEKETKGQWPFGKEIRDLMWHLMMILLSEFSAGMKNSGSS